MAQKPNNNRIEDVEQLSQLDFGGVIKDVHSFPGHYLRVRDALTLVKNHYDYLTATYDVDGRPTQVKYYVGLKQHQTNVSVSSDVAGSLNNRYFFIYEGRSNRLFHVWYNVNGAGVDPAPANSTSIEIEIDTNDAAGIVAQATELVLNSSAFKEYFTARRAGSIVYITANKAGVSNDSLDFDTGFTILNQQGTSQLMQTVDVDYDGIDPLFDGQALKGYYYDIFTGAFKRNTEVTISDDVGLGKTPTIIITNALLANTEYSFVLPVNTNRFVVRSRNSLAKILISFTSGGTGTGNYLTVQSGTVYSEDKLLLTTITSRTIYFQSSKAANELEILAWV